MRRSSFEMALSIPRQYFFHQNHPRAPSVPPVCCVRAAGVTLLQATCPSRARTCKELSDWSTGRGKVRLHTLSGSHKARLADPTDYNWARDLRIPTLLLRLADCSDLSLLAIFIFILVPSLLSVVESCVYILWLRLFLQTCLRRKQLRNAAKLEG